MDLVNKLYFGLAFITLISYILAFKKKEQYVKLVILLMILWLITIAAALLLISYGGLQNNLFVYHISIPLEYLILALLYKSVIINPGVKKFILFSIPSFIILSFLFSVFIQPPSANNSYTVIIESVLLVFLSLFYLREILLLQQVPVLHRLPMFWISVGILFYFTDNLVIIGMLNYAVNHFSKEAAKRIYRISYFFNYLLFVLFIIGAFCSGGIISSKKSIK